jgi:hypothetical protein
MRSGLGVRRKMSNRTILEDQKMMNLEPGKFYISIGISDMMAFTMKHVIKIVTYSDEYKAYVFSVKGKRKSYVLKVDNETLILPAEANVMVDSETGSFNGNALINILGKPEEIRKIIDGANKNPIFNKGLVVCVNPDTRKEEMLYPELAANEQHAVIKRIMAKA